MAEPKPEIERVSAVQMAAGAAEDASGFGVRELRLTRDLFLRPWKVLDAYDLGPTAGGLYPKPLPYLLAVNGLFILITALGGGMERTMPPDFVESLGTLGVRTGKSPDAFVADLDQWLTFAFTPLFVLIATWPVYLVLKRWSGAQSRPAFRHTMTLFSQQTVLSFLPGLALYFFGMTDETAAAIVFLAPLVAFLSLGRGHWFKTWPGAIGRSVLLALLLTVISLPVGVASWAFAIAAAVFLP